MTIENIASAIGMLSAVLLLAMLVWSTVFPAKRLWPPQKLTAVNQVVVWGLTIGVFVGALVVGLIDWNSLNWSPIFRWGAGFPLIVAGNLIVWRGVFHIGTKATSGGVDELRTGGLYRYSRNPQYLADIAILAVWFILSASSLTLPIVGMGIIVLLIAPLAEEPWLRKTYGQSYDDYCQKTRRYV